jgi:predicted ATPase
VNASYAEHFRRIGVSIAARPRHRAGDAEPGHRPKWLGQIEAGPESFSRAVLRGEEPVQGTPRKHPVSLRLGFSGDDFSYAIDRGLPTPPTGAFGHDPEIRRECVWTGMALRPSAVLVDRRGPLVKTREAKWAASRSPSWQWPSR